MGSRQPLDAGILVLLIVAGSVSGPALAAPHGLCASAEVAEPVRLPDGSVQQPGRFTLCEMRDYSPISSLHSFGVDGSPVALLVSRRGIGEGEAQDAPFFMFVRDGRGNLHLAGYATPAGDHMITYELMDLRRGRRVRAIAGMPPGETDGAGVSTLLLAARVD